MLTLNDIKLPLAVIQHYKDIWIFILADSFTNTVYFINTELKIFYPYPRWLR